MRPSGNHSERTARFARPDSQKWKPALADHSETPYEENVDANDPDGLLPETLEARFERQIQVYEW